MGKSKVRATLLSHLGYQSTHSAKKKQLKLGHIPPSHPNGMSLNLTEPKVQTLKQAATILRSRHEDPSFLKFLIISVKQLIYLPRDPPGPFYFSKSQDPSIIHLVYIINEEMPRCSEFLLTLKQISEPSLVPEDQILSNYRSQVHQRYLSLLDGDLSVKQKHVVNRVTIEGEHECLLVFRQRLNIEVIPLLNAPH